MGTITYRPIGVIHSPFKEVEGMPIQPCGAQGIEGTVEVYEQYCAGLKDIGGFSHIMLLYHFHLVKGYALQAMPFLGEKETHGIFAIRAPARPNPIGISVVRLVAIENNLLDIEDVDVVDGTPLLDIKPYVPDFDWREVERIGWCSGKSTRAWKERSDARFRV
ncbi:MAG: tRNA (N6-threonylcarbamoyladenosine(37)-N6)-methyltransferase TrmO [Chloroflexota bacterium]|nr:tRNA (N6-threonylcarbamoyladenosine(37)-N6)-methyltransferase TrmO [Chloroflexota bacterium]